MPVTLSVHIEALYRKSPRNLTPSLVIFYLHTQTTYPQKIIRRLPHANRLIPPMHQLRLVITVTRLNICCSKVLNNILNYFHTCIMPQRHD